VPAIIVAPLPLKPPLKLALYVGTDQLYVVPVGITPLTGVTWNNTPSHVTAVIFVTVAVGFTVITTVKLLPTQPPLDGVSVYVTDNAAFVLLVNVPTIIVFEPVNNVLVTPAVEPTALTNVYVVPVGTMPFVAPGVNAIDPPLHATCVIPDIIARGFNVTVTVNCAPTQLPDVGVTKYAAVLTTFTVFNKVPLIVD